MISKTIVVSIIIGLIFAGCTRDQGIPGGEEEEVEKDSVEMDTSLPSDLSPYDVKGGYQIPFYEGATAAPFGYYLFIPENYQETHTPYPLLVVLHGSGERGSSKNNKEELERALVHGPGRLIREGHWDASRNMLVVSAQTSHWAWTPDNLKSFIEYLSHTHKIDSKQIYMTGLSMGAYGIFDYLGEYGENAGIAAAVPICGRGKTSAAYVENVAAVPLWVFHGEEDPDVPVARAHEIVSAINALDPIVRPRMTLYPHVGHDSWTMTYDGSGMGKENRDYTPFDQDIYSWLKQYTRD